MVYYLVVTEEYRTGPEVLNKNLNDHLNLNDLEGQSVLLITTSLLQTLKNA